jgi:hypothetical protein
VGKLPPRLLGVVLLACSAGSTLVHRGVYEAARHGPSQVAEFGLGLLTFILASTGILLLIHGARLFKPVEERVDRKGLGAQTAFRSRLEVPITPQGRAFDTRHGASMMQARHQIGLSRRARTMIGTNPSKRDCAVFDWATPPRR